MSDNLILLLFCITLLLLVAAVVFLVLQERRHAAEKAALVQDYEARRDVLQEEVASLKSEKAALESRLEVQQQAQEAMLKAEKEHAAKSLEEMRTAFKALSAENSEHFRKASAESVGELLKPIQEKFKEFSEHVKSSDEKNAERSGSMEKMIRILSEQSRSVGDQARALADAITGQSKTQGDFGEMLLVDLLRESGLQEGVNFDVQGVLRDEQGHEIKSDEGRTLIPDVIVHYPDGGEVIVDSKMSLKAFVEWNQAVNPEERKRWAREHIRSIRSHVDELRGKDYASYIPEGRRKIDYNLMFIPIENAFRLMQEEEPLLWQQAKNQGVLIVSQMSLAIVLNMILVAWRQFDRLGIDERPGELDGRVRQDGGAAGGLEQELWRIDADAERIVAERCEEGCQIGETRCHTQALQRCPQDGGTDDWRTGVRDPDDAGPGAGIGR